MRGWIVLLKIFGYLWLTVAVVPIVIGVTTGPWTKGGIAAVQSLMNSLDAANWTFMLIALAPGFGALLWAMNLAKSLHIREHVQGINPLLAENNTDERQPYTGNASPNAGFFQGSTSKPVGDFLGYLIVLVVVTALSITALKRNHDSISARTWFSGVKYVGDLIDGKNYREGNYRKPKSKKPVIEGNSSKKHGQSNYANPKGNKYVGEVKNGKRHGHGTYTWSDGRKYVGEYRDGKRHGQGTFTWPDGRQFVGEYSNGRAHGQGTFTWPDGRKYAGKYSNGKWHGQGTYTWSSGQQYVGEFRNGKRNGQGTYTTPDGRKYVGEYKNNKRHGQGTYTRADGSIIHSGMWKDGKPVK